MEELLTLKPDDLRSVRLANDLEKRSSAWPYSWATRFTVLSANFLFVYNNSKELKPKRVICVDDAIVAASTAYSKLPFAFVVKTRAGKEFAFAADTAEARDKWMTSVANAGYPNMYTRTREAVKFLDKCKEVVAPFVVAVAAAKRASGGARAAPSSADAAQLADAAATSEADAKAEAARLSGADVVAAMELLRGAQSSAATGARAFKARITALEAEVRELEATGASGSAGPRSPAALGGSDASALRDRAEDLASRNVELQQRVDALNRQLNDATLAVTKATRAASSLASTGTREAKEDELMRQRLRELEQALAREREDGAAALRAEKLAGAKELTLEKERATRAAAALAASASAAAVAAAASAPAGSAAARGGAGIGGAALASPRPGTGAVAAAPAASASPQGPAPPSAAALQADSSLAYESEWAPFLLEAQRLERDGGFADAEQQYEAVLEIKRERSGAESVPVASACRDLGRVLALQRRFDRAEEHYSLAVRLCAKLLGESHPNTACALTDLAAVLREQGKFEAAEEFATRAVASLRAGVGPDDVSTATALYNLAGLAKRQGKFRAAEDAYSEALRIFRDKLGEGQGETADTLYQMGCLFRKRGETAKASSHFAAAASSYSQTFGPQDKRVAEATKRAKGMSEKGEGEKGDKRR